MALYTEESADFLQNMLAAGQENRKRKQLEIYEKRKNEIDKAHSDSSSGLSGLLSTLTRDAKAFGNTLATTGAAIASKPIQDMTNYRTSKTLEDSGANQDRIAQKYGYKDRYDAWDKGDGPDEMWKELQDATTTARKNIETISNDYKNNAAIKKINETKQSQYGADALRTMKTLAQVLGLGVTPAGGAITGALDGAADSIEAADGTLLDLEADLSGGKIKSTKDTNIDLGDMAKRAGVGAITGAATAGIGNRIGNAQSRLGSALLNNRVATSAVGRGAIGGAVGGALGGGLTAGLEGGDIGQAAMQGATSGAITGATTAGLTSAARKVGTKLTDSLGVTNQVNNLRQKLMYTPEQKPIETNSEIAKIADETINNQPVEGTEFANRTRKGNVAETLKRTGKYLEGMQAALNKSDKKAIGVKDVGKPIDGVRRKTGLDRVPEQAEFAKYITGGSDSILDTAQRNALAYDANGKPFYVDTSEIYNGIPQLMKDSKVTSSSIGGGNAKDKFIEELQNDMRDYGGDLLGLASSWHDTAATFRKSQASSAKQKAKIYETLAKQVEDASYKKIPQENVDAMFDVSIAKLKESAKTATNPKAKVAFEKTAEALENTPRTIKDFRSFKKDFVDVSNIDSKVSENENGGAVRQARTFRGSAAAVKDALIEKPAYWLANKVGVGLTSAGDKLAGIPSSGRTTQTTPRQTAPITPDLQNMYNLLGLNIGLNEAKDATNNIDRSREYEKLDNNYSQALAAIDADYAQLPSQQQIQQTSPILAQMSEIENAMTNAMAAGDMSAYSKLADMYKDAYNIYQMQTKMNGGSDGSSLSTAEKNQIAKLQSAGTALDQLESLYQKAGGGQGIIGGNIANFLGGLGLNSDVNTYNQLAQGLINQIGAAIGKTDSLNTEGEVQRALSLVPKITDDNQTAMNKLSTLRQLLQQNTNSYNQLYGA